MPFQIAQLNYPAIGVAALIAFFIGGMWYSLFFSKLWIKLQGYSDEELARMKAEMSPPLFFGGMILSYLVLAFAMALILSAFSEPTAAIGAALGLLFWIGYSAIAMTSHIASNKPIGSYLIDVSCQLVYLIVMGVLLAIWR